MSKTRFFLSLLILFFFSCENKQSPSKEITNDDVLVTLNDSILKSPKDARLYIKRALYHWQNNDNELALHDFYQSNKYDSTNPEYYFIFSDFLVNNGNGNKALIASQKAIELQPLEPKYHTQAGKICFYIKNYKSALDHLNNAIKKDIHFPEAYFYKGLTYEELKNTDKALSSYITSTEQDPTWDLPFEHIGILYAKQKNDLCIKYFDNAYNANKNNSSVLLKKAFYYKSKGNIDMAMSEYNKIVTLFPQNADALYNIGILYYEKKQYQKAIECFNICNKIEPTYAISYYMKGLCFKELKNKEMAIKNFEQTLVFDSTIKEAKFAIEKY